MKKTIYFLMFLLAVLLTNEVFSQGDSALLGYPDFTEMTLDNGLRVLIAEHHEQPAVFYRMLVKTGVRDEPKGKEGLSSLAASFLTKGAGPKSPGEIAETVDAIGAKLWAEASLEYTIIGCDVLSEHNTLGLDLFSGVVLEPAFPRKELKGLKRKAVAEIKQSYTSPFYIAHKHAYHLLLGEKYRMGREKGERTIKDIESKDIESFYGGHFLPNNSILLVIGDFSKEEMLEQITGRFKNWKGGTVKKREAVITTSMDRLIFRFVSKPDLTQATIIMLRWGISSRNPDKPAYRIMSYILGEGGFSSRLMNAVRGQEGKTYWIGGWGEYHSDYGVFRIETFTRNEEVAEMFNYISSEIEELLKNGITEEELKMAKSFFSGNIPMFLESPGKIATRVLVGLYNGFTIEQMRQEVVELYEITVDEVNRVAKEYLDPESFVLVIVGSGKGIREQLREIGEYEKFSYRDPLN